MFGKKSKDASPAGPKVNRSALVLIASVAAIVVVAVVFGRLRTNLLRSQRFAGKTARVCLVRPPSWVPTEEAPLVVDAIAAVAKGRNILDPKLAGDLYYAAAAQPWIAKVHGVTKYGDGKVVVEADFRRPTALVMTSAAAGEDMVVVDSEGVVLPVEPSKLAPGSLKVIRELSTKPPQPGHKWDSPELAEGLKLIKLLQNKPYFSEITTVDVRNYNNRGSAYEPQLRLVAQSPEGALTDIRFGRFTAADGLDYAVVAERKLAYLDKYYQAHGRISGFNSFIDLRYDQLHVSTN